MREIAFHFGAAGHPVSWGLHAVYGSHYGVALAAAREWYGRQLATAVRYESETPPGGQFVIELKNESVVRADLLFDAAYFRDHQEPDDISWLCQFHAFPLEIPESIKDVVTKALRRHLIDVGFLIPRAEWETRYPDQAEYLRQFQALRRNEHLGLTTGEEGEAGG